MAANRLPPSIVTLKQSTKNEGKRKEYNDKVSNTNDHKWRPWGNFVEENSADEHKDCCAYASKKECNAIECTTDGTLHIAHEEYFHGQVLYDRCHCEQNC